MHSNISRRSMMQIAAGSLAATLAGPALAARRKLGPDFLWGAATAGHQVEGGNGNSDSWGIDRKSTRLNSSPLH